MACSQKRVQKWYCRSQADEGKPLTLPKRFYVKAIIPGHLYRFFFALLALVYITGLFVPLMDSDSAHHANIALHMYLTGDYHSLIDNGRPYLDKPHLHFWLCALSYKIFGVTGFAYKFPSFLFSILGVYATFRLGKALYNTETGKLAALIVASAFAFILANNDVRMDAVLTACIALSTWQLVEFIQQKKMVNVVGAALGLALGFCTKGHIAVFTPAVGVFFYIIYLKEWPLFYNWKWIVLFILFGLFISPVVYSYYLQYNLHPETAVRGKDHINGVKFILLSQSVERFGGEMGHDGANDRLFFIHSFLWAFAPWSIIAYIALIARAKNVFARRQEWLTSSVFLTMLVIISVSSFKLPHYLNIVFPASAVFTAAFLCNNVSPAATKKLYRLQVAVAVILLLVALLVNVWAFRITGILVLVTALALLALVFYFLLNRRLGFFNRLVAVSVSSIAFAFFLLNTNFYPKLLSYQAGNLLAAYTKNKVDAHHVYLWNEHISASYNFYTATLRQQFSDDVLKTGKEVWLLFDIKSLEEIQRAGYTIGEHYTSRDFEITRLNFKFINPATRDAQCTKMILGRISRR